jgi:hypothetical protein
MQATTLNRGTGLGTRDDVLPGGEVSAAPETFRHTFHNIPVARSIAVLLDSGQDGGVPEAIIVLARRHRARVVIYDLGTGSRWTTPYEPNDEGNRFRGRLLSSPQLRLMGHHNVARALSEINRAGIAASAFLANRPGAGDLSDMVLRERIDLVVAIGPLHGKAARNVQSVRALGAALFKFDADGVSALYPARAVEDRTEQPGRQVASPWWARIVRSRACPP